MDRTWLGRSKRLGRRCPLHHQEESVQGRRREVEGPAKGLEQLGELASEAIRKELTVEHSLEARRRLQTLLDNANQPTSSQLRSLRAIEVLEAAGSPEAIRILERLAQGNPDGIVTLESRAVVARIKKMK